MLNLNERRTEYRIVLDGSGNGSSLSAKDTLLNRSIHNLIPTYNARRANNDIPPC